MVWFVTDTILYVIAVDIDVALDTNDNRIIKFNADDCHETQYDYVKMSLLDNGNNY